MPLVWEEAVTLRPRVALEFTSRGPGDPDGYCVAVVVLFAAGYMQPLQFNRQRFMMN